MSEVAADSRRIVSVTTIVVVEEADGTQVELPAMKLTADLAKEEVITMVSEHEYQPVYKDGEPEPVAIVDKGRGRAVILKTYPERVLPRWRAGDVQE